MDEEAGQGRRKFVKGLGIKFYDFTLLSFYAFCKCFYLANSIGGMTLDLVSCHQNIQDENENFNPVESGGVNQNKICFNGKTYHNSSRY